MSHIKESAASGTRTRTTIPGQGILSPSCLPFHHRGSQCGCKGSVFFRNGQKKWRNILVVAVEAVAVELDAILYEPSVVLAAVGGDALGVGVVLAAAFLAYEHLSPVGPAERVVAQRAVEQTVGTLPVEAFQTVEVGASHNEPPVSTHVVVVEPFVLDGRHHLHVLLFLRPLTQVGCHHEVGDTALQLWNDDDELAGTGQGERENTVRVIAGIESKAARVARGILLLTGTGE